MWERLKLYSVLDILGEDVLYFDTDSVIFKVSSSDLLSKLPIGNYLGELTTSSQNSFLEVLKITHIGRYQEKKNVKFEDSH